MRNGEVTATKVGRKGKSGAIGTIAVTGHRAGNRNLWLHSWQVVSDRGV